MFSNTPPTQSVLQATAERKHSSSGRRNRALLKLLSRQSVLLLLCQQVIAKNIYFIWSRVTFYELSPEKEIAGDDNIDRPIYYAISPSVRVEFTQAVDSPILHLPRCIMYDCLQYLIYSRIHTSVRFALQQRRCIESSPIRAELKRRRTGRNVPSRLRRLEYPGKSTSYLCMHSLYEKRFLQSATYCQVQVN